MFLSTGRGKEAYSPHDYALSKHFNSSSSFDYDREYDREPTDIAIK